jgi:hypothetical protein
MGAGGGERSAEFVSREGGGWVVKGVRAGGAQSVADAGTLAVPVGLGIEGRGRFGVYWQSKHGIKTQRTAKKGAVHSLKASLCSI